MSSSVRAVRALAEREIVRFLRQPSRIAAAIGTPLLFWLVLGSGLGSSFRPDGLGGTNAGYLGYFFPGAVLMVVLFSSIFGAISLIEDRREGFLQGVLVAPVSRLALVVGKVLGVSLLSLAQALVMIVLLPASKIPLSATHLPTAFLALTLTSCALSALGVAFALRMDSVQGFHGVMNLVLFPLWLLSGALFPASGAAPVLQVLMKLNPVYYAHAALLGLTGFSSSESPTKALGIVGVFATACIIFAWRMAWPKKRIRVN